MYHNNPVSVANHERKFLWPDVAENSPDILLSLGTGKFGRKMEEQMAELAPQLQQTTRSRNAELAAKSSRRTKPRWKRAGTPKVVNKYFSVLINRIDNILNSELEWRRFRNEGMDKKQGQEQDSRFILVNIDLGREPPKMDEKIKLAGLQDIGTQILKTDEYRSIIEKIAHTLVASTFYFTKIKFQYNEEFGTWTCTGRILCRFESTLSESVNNVRALGDYLRHQQSSGYQPFFTVNTDRQKIPITESMIESMINRADFHFEDLIDIHVPSQLSSTTIYLRMRGIHSEQTNYYPISGFPRCLIAEDTINETRLDKRAEFIKERRYGGLAVANDPRLAFPDDTERPPEAPPKDGDNDKQPPLAKSDTNDTTGTSTSAASTTSAGHNSQSRASSATLMSQLSGESSSSQSKARRQPISVADLRAEAAQTGGPIKIQDGDELAKSMAAMLETVGSGSGALMDEPDFDSDDSDVPPSEGDKKENEDTK